MKITIVGAGNAGCAQAFKFTEVGHEVTLLKTSNSLHEENFEKIVQNGGIWAIDHTENDKRSFQKLKLITRNVKLALSEAELIVILTQSLQHQDIANNISPFISDTTKMILLIPGNLGSLFFRSKLKSRNIILSEGESTPFDARIIEPGLVNILYKNVRNALSFMPSNKRDDGLTIAEKLVDTYKYFRKNIIETLLHNPNLVVHTVGTIMSASRIENMCGEFWMYRESFSPSIWNIINKLDEEKNSIIELFGGEKISYLDACKFRNESDLNKNSLEVFKSYANDGGPKGPSTLYTRYILEDVAVELCMLSSLGKKFMIETPICDALVTMASALVQKDFFKEGRSLKTFELEEYSCKELIELLNN